MSSALQRHHCVLPLLSLQVLFRLCGMSSLGFPPVESHSQLLVKVVINKVSLSNFISLDISCAGSLGFSGCMLCGMSYLVLIRLFFFCEDSQPLAFHFQFVNRLLQSAVFQSFSCPSLHRVLLQVCKQGIKT